MSEGLEECLSYPLTEGSWSQGWYSLEESNSMLAPKVVMGAQADMRINA